MEINQVLIEYAKLHLQLVQANQYIAQLQQQVKKLTPEQVPTPEPTPAA